MASKPCSCAIGSWSAAQVGEKDELPQRRYIFRYDLHREARVAPDNADYAGRRHLQHGLRRMVHGDATKSDSRRSEVRTAHTVILLKTLSS